LDCQFERSGTLWFGTAVGSLGPLPDSRRVFLFIFLTAVDSYHLKRKGLRQADTKQLVNECAKERFACAWRLLLCVTVIFFLIYIIIKHKTLTSWLIHLSLRAQVMGKSARHSKS